MIELRQVNVNTGVIWHYRVPRMHVMHAPVQGALQAIVPRDLLHPPQPGQLAAVQVVVHIVERSVGHEHDVLCYSCLDTILPHLRVHKQA